MDSDYTNPDNILVDAIIAGVRHRDSETKVMIYR
jgi:hypothetical protein